MTILITGASSGVGRATAKYLDSFGDTYRLILLARRMDALTTLQAELQHPAQVISYDLRDTQNLEQIFIACKEKGIKFDGLVHCAGIWDGIPIRSNTAGDAARVMETNYLPFVELGRIFASRKYFNNNGSIVVISSLSSFTCYAGTLNYTVSKAAVNAAVRVMAKELLNRKIRVNAICPANINTPMGPSEDDLAFITQQQLGIIKVEYVAYLIEYLLSDRAKYITGAVIQMSAGMNYAGS